MSHPASAHLRAFLEDPKGVSALAPTSAPVAARIVSKVRPGEARLIIEYGPGNGVLTRRLLERLAPDGRYLAIERNESLAARLTEALEDPRLAVVHDSAQHVGEILARHDLPAADYVVSGIPFTWLPPETTRRTVAATHRALTDNGRFVTYQTFYQRRRHLRAHLEHHFARVESEIDFRNLPPYRICVAVK